MRYRGTILAVTGGGLGLYIRWEAPRRVKASSSGRAGHLSRRFIKDLEGQRATRRRALG